MRLGSATDGDVLKNESNGSYYRFERLERGKARIRPLELFPNGRLLPKPVDTTVSTELAVLMVGRWAEGMRVDGRPSRPRARYEAELEARQRDLVDLRLLYEALPVNGVGKQSRGSWMNKVKNVEQRIAAIEAGLADVTGEALAAPVDEARSGAAFHARDVVLLPSGRPGLVVIVTTHGKVPSARVRVRDGAATLEIPGVPLEALRPYSDSQLCTL